MNPEQIGLYILLGWASLAIPIGFMFALYPERQTERLLNSVRKHATKEKWEGLSAAPRQVDAYVSLFRFSVHHIGNCHVCSVFDRNCINWH